MACMHAEASWIISGYIVNRAHNHGTAGYAEQRRGGRGGSSLRKWKAAQRSCKTTLTGGGRSRQHDEHAGAALLTCMVGTFLGSYSDFVHMKNLSLT